MDALDIPKAAAAATALGKAVNAIGELMRGVGGLRKTRIPLPGNFAEHCFFYYGTRDKNGHDFVIGLQLKWKRDWSGHAAWARATARDARGEEQEYQFVVERFRGRIVINIHNIAVRSPEGDAVIVLDEPPHRSGLWTETLAGVVRNQSWGYAECLGPVLLSNRRLFDLRTPFHANAEEAVQFVRCWRSIYKVSSVLPGLAQGELPLVSSRADGNTHASSA